MNYEKVQLPLLQDGEALEVDAAQMTDILLYALAAICIACMVAAVLRP